MTKDRRFIIRSSLSLQMLAFYYYLKFYVTGKRDNKNDKDNKAGRFEVRRDVSTLFQENSFLLTLFALSTEFL